MNEIDNQGKNRSSFEDWDNTESLFINESDKMREHSNGRKDQQANMISKKTLSKKLSLVLMLVIVGFIGIYSWSFVFQHLGLTPFSNEDKAQETQESVSAALQHPVPNVQIKSHESLQAENRAAQQSNAQITIPEIPNQYKAQGNQDLAIKLPEPAKIEGASETLEIKTPEAIESTGDDKKLNTQAVQSIHKKFEEPSVLQVHTNKTEVPKKALATAQGKYTLQILGLQDKAKAKSFIAQNNVKGKLKLRQTTHEGKPWFVITYGQFSSHEQAKLAIEKLPVDLKTHKPWVRTLNEFQETKRGDS